MKNFKVEANELLQRNELKSVFGGQDAERPCKVFDTTEGTWLSGYSVADAQWLYNNNEEVSGYCCASC